MTEEAKEKIGKVLKFAGTAIAGAAVGIGAFVLIGIFRKNGSTCSSGESN
jgi:hypothetical protein